MKDSEVPNKPAGRLCSVFSLKSEYSHLYNKRGGGTGQLISKANCQAEDSPKKRTNEFVFTSMRPVFVRFLGESSARRKTFRDYLTFITF